jgi:hypothetical protein
MVLQMLWHVVEITEVLSNFTGWLFLWICDMGVAIASMDETGEEG